MSLATMPGPSPGGGLRAPPQIDRAPGLTLWNLSVLLVDDDAADTSLILNVLRRHPDVSTARAIASPILALRQLAASNNRPDLVLLDIHMPQINGFEFLERLRQIPGMARVPVVFLTTSGLDKNVAQYMRTSASQYVLKPDTYGELQARLDRVIKRAISGLWNR
jgi:putative two-component system response regulator